MSTKPEINQEALSALSLADILSARNYVKSLKLDPMHDFLCHSSYKESIGAEIDALDKEIAKRFANIFTY